MSDKAKVKDDALDELVRLVAEVAIEDEQKEAPPEVVPAEPRERLSIDQVKTKKHKAQD